MKSRFQDAEDPLKLAIERRYFDVLPLLYDLKKRSRFLVNYLSDYSRISEQDKDDRLQPFKLSHSIYRSNARFGDSERIPFQDMRTYSSSIDDMNSRLQEDTSLEDNRQFYDINVPIARRFANTLLTASIQNQFSAKYVGFNSDIRTLMFSNSLNFHIQRLLKKGGYFDEVFPVLKFADIVEGTTYLRIDYDKNYKDDGTLVDKIKFSQIPIWEVIDDGRYTSDANNDLENSKFVIQLHTLDKETLVKLLNKFKKKIDLSQIETAGSSIYDSGYSYFSPDTEDINALWERYAVEEYKTMRLLEVFWKEYESEKSDKFTWQRTFFVLYQAKLVELITVPSDYVFGLPIIRKKHQISLYSNYGYTPTPNNVNTDLAKNSILNSKFHEARRNSYQKLFMSSVLANMKDEVNQYWTPYRDQIFNKVPLKMSSGQSIKNFLGSFDHPQIDSQPILMIDRLSQEVAVDFSDPPVNPNRTSSSALSEFYRQQNQKFQPMFIAEKLFIKQLVKKLYKILKTAYTSDDLEQINKMNKTYSDGLDLYSFNISEAPEDLEDLGIDVVMKNEEEAIKNQQLEMLLPLIQQLGPAVLQDENLISYLGLREKGFFLPSDKEKLTYLKDIYNILNKKITLEDIQDIEENPEMGIKGKPSKVILYKQNVDETSGVITKEYTLQNHKMAVELTKDYIVKNRYEFSELDEEVRFALMTYLDEHTKAMEMNMASAQAKIMQMQQMQNPQQQAQQEMPPELAQLQQQ